MSAIHSVGSVIAEALAPSHFFVAPPATLEWQHADREEVPWEIFRGQLLDRSQTRLRRAFETWNGFWSDGGERSAEPLLAVLFDAEAGQVHVTRSIHCYGWEGYHAGNNVYLSREVRKWQRELVGTFTFALHGDAEVLCAELRRYLVQAMVGASRLPLASVEAPLPGFSLGRIAYFPQPLPGECMRSYRELIGRSLHAGLLPAEQARHLEFFLRSTPAEDLPAAVDLYVARGKELGRSPEELPRLLRAVFDEVALSPWTDFADKMLRFLDLLVARRQIAVEAQIDFLGYLLRHLARHLTAYDLITFHHRGANYPDALLLDAVLKAYLGLAEAHPACFDSRMRRRALRQGWLMRRAFEGLPVPDAPTSPGENARVLPPPHQRVPEEQIFNPARRTRRLFADDPLTHHLGEHGRDLLRQSLADLRHPDELRELGMALFLDRPLGVGKAPGEPDRTLLLSYEAFSRTVAERQLRTLERVTQGLTEAPDWEGFRTALAGLPVQGVELGPARPGGRPGVVSVEDARKVADDWRFLRTTRRSVTDFLKVFDLAPFDVPAPVLLLRDPAAECRLIVYDANGHKCLELQVDLTKGYERCADAEYPAGGLRVIPLSGGS